MPLTQQIVFIGPMGVGKSTVARLLAKQLNLPFKDSDSVIESRTGASISWIFDVEGEEKFRQRETQVLKELLQQRKLVLATGGGMVMKSENRQMLQQADEVIYLLASVEHLVRRTKHDKNRPLLQVEEPEKIIRNLFELRDPLYRQVATRIVTAEAKNPRTTARAIAKDIARDITRDLSEGCSSKEIAEIRAEQCSLKE